MLALGLDGGRVMLVDEATGEVKWEVQAHAGGYSRVTISPNYGRFVASVGSDENWRLWDAASGAEWMAGARHDGTGACICGVDDQGHRLLQEGCPVVAHTAGLHASAFSPCGQRLATGDNDGAVILWDAQTGEAEQRMQGGSDLVYCVTFSADGAWLASGSGDGSIRLWDATTGALLRATQQADTRGKLHFSPTDILILASSSYDLITLWDVDSGKMIRSFAGCFFAVFSPDGRTIATPRSADYRDLLLVNAETGALRLRLVGHQQRALSACFVGRDANKLASVCGDGTCKVWDSSTGALLRTINVPTKILLSVSWGRDWVRDTETGVAFAMGHHPRLGAESQVLALDAGVVRMILDRV